MNSGRDRGVGIRVTAGDITGYAHTSDLSAQGLSDAARTAAAVAARQPHGGTVDMMSFFGIGLAEPQVAVLPASVGAERKVALLRAADDAARSTHEAITQVTARYGESRRRIMVANTSGVCAADDQVRTLFSVGCVASGDGGLQTGRETVGYTVGWELFDDYDPAELAERAAQRAVTKLAARPAPSGEVPVVIACGGGRSALPRGLRSWTRSRSGSQRGIGVRWSGGLPSRRQRRDAGRRRHDGTRVGSVGH